MPSKKFSVDYLCETIGNKSPADEYAGTCIGREITDQGRWMTYYNMIFSDASGDTWSVDYGRGSTEYQDNGIEWRGEDNEEVKCEQVQLVEKVVKVWEVIN